MAKQSNHFFIFIALCIFVMAASGGVVSAETSAAPTSIFVVDSTFDFPDLMDDGICLAPGGVCTLRAAIEEANRDATHDIIRFDLGGSASILPTSQLPTIRTKITIDGKHNPNDPANDNGSCPTATSQGSYGITLSGFNAPINSHGLVIGPAGDGTVIAGLNIVLWKGNTTLGGAGIFIDSNSDNNIIQCNHIGISNLPLSGSQNRSGIIVLGSSNEIGGTAVSDRNVILAEEDGIRVAALPDTANNNVIQGNYVGTNQSGTAAPGNMRHALVLGTDNNTVDNNILSGANLIGGKGLSLSGDSNTITNNKIGTDVAGSSPLPNSIGIEISKPSTGTYVNNTIGGSAATSNTIAFNGTGIIIRSSSSGSPTTVSYNSIHANTGSGIWLAEGAGNAIEFNDIYGNGGNGILIDGTPVSTRADVTSNVIYDNGLNGIHVDIGAGAVVSVVENSIYGNSKDGIATDATINIQSSEIYDNGELGIDIGNDGISPTNAPALTTIFQNGQVIGSYGSNSESATIEVFVSDSCDDQLSGGQPFGEGKTLHATVSVNKVNGEFDFATSPFPAGKVVTVLHRRSNSTTEFSNCVELGATTFVVNSTNNGGDTNPGDGFCATSVGGFCTLSAAIEEANALGGGPHRIEFDLGSGLKLLNPNEPLVVNTPLIIDGSTYDDGYCPRANGSVNLKIAVSGLLMNAGDSILTLGTGSDGSVVRGLALVVSKGDGIRVESDDNVIVCNLIGIQSDGNPGGNDDDGIDVRGNNTRIGSDDSFNNYADRNIIADNGDAGISVTGNATGTIINGNFIGTDLEGDGELANDFYGIYMASSANHTQVGGTRHESQNIIAGGSRDGIFISSSAYVTITENLIGELTNGTAAGNGRYGVQVSNSTNVAIGLNSRPNTVRDSGSHGVYIVDSAEIEISQNDLLEAGSAGNGSGIALIRSNAITIHNNDIYSNIGSGIYMHDAVSDVTARFNDIGISTARGATLGNSFDGIHVNVNVSDVTLSDNVLRYNNRNGVRVDNSSSGIVMLDNLIYENGSIGIDLGEDGITNNDLTPDADTGANGKTNFPIITSANATNNRIEADIKAKPNTEYVVQFFANSDCVSAPREGAVQSGERTVTTDSKGFAAVVALGGNGVNISEGDGVTATATESNGDGTSEFSVCFEALANAPTAVSLVAQAAPTQSLRMTGVLLVSLILLVLTHRISAEIRSGENQ